MGQRLEGGQARTGIVSDHARTYKKSATPTQRNEKVDKCLSGTNADTENWTAKVSVQQKGTRV